MTGHPEDLLRGKFLKLPPNILLRWKVLSKDCRSLITDRAFMKEFLEEMKKEPTRLLLDYGDYMHAMVEVVDVVEEGESISLSLEEKFQDLEGVEESISLEGKFQDLSLLSVQDLLNSATRDSREFFPIENSIYDYQSQYCMTFGYDQRSDDYKLLQFPIGRTTLSHRPHPHPFCFVQALKSQVWKRIPFTDYQIDGPGILIHGNLHWVSLKYSDPKVVVFKLAQEIFDEILMPEIGSGTDFSLQITSTDGNLAIARFQGRVEYQIQSFELWILRDYEDLRTWYRVQVPLAGLKGHFFLPYFQMDFLIWMHQRRIPNQPLSNADFDSEFFETDYNLGSDSDSDSDSDEEFFLYGLDREKKATIRTSRKRVLSFSSFQLLLSVEQTNPYHFTSSSYAALNTTSL